MNRLYDEFAHYYEMERCEWAPENPRRVFNLAFDIVYPRFWDGLTEEEFLTEVYDTLGFSGSIPRGLFHTFDPKKYSGPLPLPDHFVNLFRAKLEGRLRDRRRKLNKRRRRKYKPGSVTPEAERRLKWVWGSSYDRVGQERMAALAEGLSTLTPSQFRVVHMTYWGRYSHREVALELGLDRKTVRALARHRHRELKAFYGIAQEIAA